MNETRSSYVKILPFAFLAALLLVGIQILIDYNVQAGKELQQRYLSTGIAFGQMCIIWLSLGYAFRQWKAALFALGTGLLLSVFDIFIYKQGIALTSPLLKTLSPLLLGHSFFPALVFGFISFKKQALRYFWPIMFLFSAFTVTYIGCYYFETSPFNTWLHLFHIGNIFELRLPHDTFRTINLLFYAYVLAVLMITIVVIGECYTAATAGKKWKQQLRVDLATNYTNGGAITLFLFLRLVINLLVIGLFTYPLSFVFPSGRVYVNGQTFGTFLITCASALALLVAAVLYYRKFLVEYFMACRQPIQWAYWLVNIPVIGLLVFPFVVLTTPANTTEADRHLFFYNNAMHNQKPWQIMPVITVVTLLGSYFLRNVNGAADTRWYLLIAELCLFAWYVASITGYYAILAAGTVTCIIFIQKLNGKHHTENQWIYQPSRFDLSLALWYLTAFNVIQYTILLPVFHLKHIRTVQDQPVQIEGFEEVGIPIGQRNISH